MAKAKQAPKAKAKKKVLKAGHYFKGLGSFPKGTEVTTEMEKAFKDSQDTLFDPKDMRNKGVKLPTLDQYCEELKEDE